MTTTNIPQPPKFKKMDLRTLQKKRTANFREDETKLLIQLWGSPSIQNKLFLTHRKAPVMRLLAANMQQRGFYRTPDEIKTRIRNLKCLYHRIKRSMACGTGIGTVDPDWPHFKAMDDILSKEYPRKECDRIMEEALEGTNKNKPQEDETTIEIKQEVDDVDIDDNDSWATNDSINSEYDEDSNPPPPLKPAPTSQPTTFHQTTNTQAKQIIVAASSGYSLAPSTITTSVSKPVTVNQGAPKLQTILPAFSLNQNTINANGANKSLPFPLLILNSVPQNTDKNVINPPAAAATINKSGLTSDDGTSNLLKEMIGIQKEYLVAMKELSDIEKQRLEFDRLIGTQMVTLIPMLGGLLQRLAYPSNQELLDLDLKINSGKRKRVNDDVDILKDSKILRNMLEQGIKKYMMFEEDKDSENEDDSGIQNNDTHSISSDKSDKSVEKQD